MLCPRRGNTHRRRLRQHHYRLAVDRDGDSALGRHRSGNCGCAHFIGSSQITIPNIQVGENAEIAQSDLEKAGLNKVRLSSANPKYSMVLLPQNWTVVGVEPTSGTIVGADDPVVLKVTKE